MTSPSKKLADLAAALKKPSPADVIQSFLEQQKTRESTGKKRNAFKRISIRRDAKGNRSMPFGGSKRKKKKQIENLGSIKLTFYYFLSLGEDSIALKIFFHRLYYRFLKVELHVRYF